jgi:hypothetical protein
MKPIVEGCGFSQESLMIHIKTMTYRQYKPLRSLAAGSGLLRIAPQRECKVHPWSAGRSVSEGCSMVAVGRFLSDASTFFERINRLLMGRKQPLDLKN